MHMNHDGPCQVYENYYAMQHYFVVVGEHKKFDSWYQVKNIALKKYFACIPGHYHDLT